MKNVSTIVLFALLLSPLAHADENQESVLGAVAGGVLGSTIGQGDGRKIATVLGAIIGYNAGPQVLGANNNPRYIYSDPQYYTPAIPMNRYNRIYPTRRYMLDSSDIYRACEWQNPYRRDSQFYWDYNRECVQRLDQDLRIQRGQAYEQGFRKHYRR